MKEDGNEEGDEGRKGRESEEDERDELTSTASPVKSPELPLGLAVCKEEGGLSEKKQRSQ